MTEVQNTISKLYSLRAGMSVLSMQYDKYFDVYLDIAKIYAELAKRFKQIIGSELKSSCDNVRFLNLSNFLNNSAYKRNGVPRLEYDGHHSHYDAATQYYWLDLLTQCCYFDLNNFSENRHNYKNSYYKHFNEIFNKYNVTNMNNDSDYMEWQRSFENASDEQQLARDCIVSIVNENKDDQMLYWKAQELLDNVIGGQWLTTDESLTHFKTKKKELNELLNVINSDNEQLKPQGFFEKHFKKDKNAAEIAKNTKRMSLGSIAVRNAQNAVDFIERETPETKSTTVNKLKSIENLNVEYNQIFRALQDEYSSLLDIRDWENIDLVIYFMETGRADTIKEALQQVDMEKRTDRIVQTIRDATDRICSTIAMSFAALNASIKQCFAVLENRINEQNALIDQQNSRIAELASATNMNNALISKQATSSEKLMKDIKSLKAAVSNK